MRRYFYRYANDKRLTTIESKLYNIKAEGIYRFEPLIAAISHTISSVIIEGEKKYNGIKQVVVEKQFKEVA